MAENGKPVAVGDGDFSETIEKHEGLSLVDFWAEWCGPCRMVAPVMEQLAEEYQGRIRVAKLDVDANQSTAIRFNIRSIPSILFFKDGKHVDTVVGAVPKPHLERKIQEHLS
ncbi:MAG: thioredoxin [Longimicrobiales bacterium]